MTKETASLRNDIDQMTNAIAQHREDMTLLKARSKLAITLTLTLNLAQTLTLILNLVETALLKARPEPVPNP